MTQEPPKSNIVLIIIAVIGVIGTIIGAAITVIGNYNIEKMRQELELTRIALAATATQGMATQASTVITTSIPINTPTEIPTNTVSPTLILATNPTATVQQVLPTFQPVLKNTPTLQPPWDILLNNWQDSKILKQSGDKTVIAVGTFIFKVISSKGNYCGIVTSGSTLDSVKEFNTPLLEYYPTTRNNLLIYLTMSDGKNDNSYDMEDFCLDPPGYTFVIMHETNGIIAMRQMELPIPSAP